MENYMPVEWVTDRIIVIDYCQSKSQSVRQNNFRSGWLCACTWWDTSHQQSVRGIFSSSHAAGLIIKFRRHVLHGQMINWSISFPWTFNNSGAADLREFPHEQPGIKPITRTKRCFVVFGSSSPWSTSAPLAGRRRIFLSGSHGKTVVIFRITIKICVCACFRHPQQPSMKCRVRRWEQQPK